MKNFYSAMQRSATRYCGPAWLLPAIALIMGSSFRLSADPFTTERTVIQLAKSWDEQIRMVSENQGLTGICSNGGNRQSIFTLLEEIHYYHDLLETDLESTSYDHSRRTIRRILKEIDKLGTEYPPEEFAEFFREQCWLRSKTEKNAKIYNTGFGTHSYGGKIYVQEAITEWYLKRLSRRISRIKKNVERFYAKRLTANLGIAPEREAV